MLEHWLSHRKSKAKAPTMNRQLRVIKLMMRKAEAWKLADPQDWRSVKKAKEAPGKILFYSPAELQRWLQIQKHPADNRPPGSSSRPSPR